MAALPVNQITTSMISQAIGVGSNDVGTLFLHDNVNEFGFNPPGINNFNAVWGKPSYERAKLSPNNPDYTPIVGILPGYAIGYFRGYDHDWVTYMNGGIDMEGDNYYEQMVFKLYIDRIPKLNSKPAPTSTVEHSFKIEFARAVNAFQTGTSVVMLDEFNAHEPYGTFTIDAMYPPDYSVNGRLESGETFYLKITHLSSPERRWIDYGEPIAITSFVTPESLYTNTYEIRNISATAVKMITPSVLNIFTVSADLWADYGEQKTMNFSASMSNTSDFSANVFTVTLPTVTIPINSTPGTKTYVQNLGFNLSGTGIHQYVSVGSTVYYKIMKDGVQIYTGSKVVTNTPPQD
jgi:hypothetical protein